MKSNALNIANAIKENESKLKKAIISANWQALLNRHLEYLVYISSRLAGDRSYCPAFEAENILFYECCYQYSDVNRCIEQHELKESIDCVFKLNAKGILEILYISADDIKEECASRTGRSAWSKGVLAYACDLLDFLQENRKYFDGDCPFDNIRQLENFLLNGAKSWRQYSEGGNALIYDGDIAERLCTPSELKMTEHGQRRPNCRESWIDVQSRALYQAFALIRISVISFKNKLEAVISDGK